MQCHRVALRMLLLSVFLVKMRTAEPRSSSSSPSSSFPSSLPPPPPPPPSPSHAHRQRKEQQGQLRALESSLLGMLGLGSVPRPRRQVRVPEYMLDLYRYRTAQQQAAASSGATATALAFHLGRASPPDTTIRSFLAQEGPRDDDDHLLDETTSTGRSSSSSSSSSSDSGSGSGSLHLWFNVSTLPASERLKASELRLYRPRLQGAHRKCNKGLHLQVFDVLSRPGKDTMLRLIDTRPVDVRHSAWESFDVLPAVLRWRQEPLSNHGLRVRLVRGDGDGGGGGGGGGAGSGAAAGAGSEAHQQQQQQARFGRALSRTMPGSSAQWEDRQPLLVTYSDDGRPSSANPARSKRSPRKHRRKGRKDNCRRHSLYVDFSDVGWNDWIVAPPGYQAYYCNGECPFPLGDHLNSTNHAIVQTLMNSVHQTIVPRACCVPTELSAISMLYVDEYDKVVLKNYQDMVVEGCGCR